MSEKIKKDKQTTQRKKDKHEVKVLSTKIPNIKVKINCQHYTDGSIALLETIRCLVER